MKELEGKVFSLHVAAEHGAPLTDVDAMQFELDGIVGDRYRSYSRTTWAMDKQPQGTVRRNERHWSATSREELEQISNDMGLAKTLSAGAARVNICLQGIPSLSCLPKGTTLSFKSGVVLTVVEYNPPCLEQGQEIAAAFSRKDGGALTDTAFSKAAKLSRGVVGVVDVPGDIAVGDDVVALLYETPDWLIHPAFRE